MATWYRSGISKEVKSSNISSFQAKRVRRALEIIQATPSKELIRMDNVKKIKVQGREDMYLYRVDLRQRIILSIDNEHKIIHSIVDAGNIKGK